MLAVLAAVTRHMGLIVTALASYLHVNVPNQSGRSLARLRSDDPELVEGLGRLQ